MFINPTAETLRDLLRNARTIAVVGLSDREDRDSNRVARYMKLQGYEIIPVNPGAREILGVPSVADLMAITKPVDIVNVFRRSEHVPAIADAAIHIGAKALWTQIGIGDDDAAQRAASAGLVVVMNRCLMVEHRRYILNF